MAEPNLPGAPVTPSSDPGPDPSSPSTPPSPWASTPGGGIPAPAVPPPPRRSLLRTVLGSWVIRIGIILVIGLGAYAFRDRLSGAASDLQVGDCFNEPANTTVVSDVQHQPCNEAHDAEIVYVGQYPKQDTYPGKDAFDAFTQTNCVPAFQAYVGRDFQSDTEYNMGVFYPLADGWSKGDHEVTCYVDRIDGAKLTTSVKASGG